MSAREEAAANAHLDAADIDIWRRTESVWDGAYEASTAILAAADAVMFSEEALDRAAKALCAAEFPEVSPSYAWNVQFEDGQRHYREMAHAVIAELRAES